MKKIFTTIVIYCCSWSAYAQQLMPLTVNKINDEFVEVRAATRTLKGKARDSGTVRIEDSIKSVTTAIVAKRIDEMNKLPDFFVSGIGGVSNLETVGQAGGNFSLTTRFRLGDFKQVGESYWTDPAYVYIGFNTRTNSSDDTGNIVKSFLFPDISKRDFVLGFYWNFSHIEKGWAIDPTIEFSLNRYKVVSDSSSNDLESANTVSISFKSESFMLGCKISKVLHFSIGKDTSYEAGFFIYPYYSLINVQPKNFSGYHEVIAGSQLPATMHSMGLQAGITLSKLQLFANMKYVMNDSRNIGPADLQGFTYTIGTVIGVDVLKFNLGE